MNNVEFALQIVTDFHLFSSLNPTVKSAEEIWRDDLKEHRGRYLVEYCPADSHRPFASVDLVYHDAVPEPAEIRRDMEHEMQLWVSRYCVPVFVASFDATGSKLRLGQRQDGSEESILMAYRDPKNAQLRHQWGLFKDEELPEEQKAPEYLKRVYKDVPFRRATDVRAAVEVEHQRLKVGIRIFRTGFILIAAIPLLIEMASWGIEWLSRAMQALSFSAGLYKVAKVSGLIKESKKKQAEREKERIMAHYYYHCSRNPQGFERLKIENFDREATDKTRKEAAELQARQASTIERDASRSPPSSE